MKSKMVEGKSIERIAPRVAILDAVELDNAIYNIVKSQTNLIANYLPAWILNKYESELDTLLRFGIWKLSVEKNNSTFGQQLLHLKYSNDSKLGNLKILALLTIVGPYLKERLLNSASASEDSSLRKAGQLLEGIETSIKLLNILTFIRFLWRGGAPSFLELILQLKPVSTIPQSKRNVGYSYMTRELIWHGFIELLVILLPLINYHRLRRKICRLFSGNNKKSVRPNKKCVFSATTLCEICRKSPILPYHMGCSHAFCYLCLVSNREADRMYECPSCGFVNTDVNAARPVQNAASLSFSRASVIFNK